MECLSQFQPLRCPVSARSPLRRSVARMDERKRVWLTPLQRVEWNHAAAQHVFQRAIAAEEAARVYSAFEANRKSGVFVEANIPDAAYEKAVELARRHGPQMGIRTLDALRLASALELVQQSFGSSISARNDWLRL
jgi:hypothetical protein